MSVFKNIREDITNISGLKTSNEWYDIVKDKFKIEIIDPDGWGTTNFQYSFYEEKIFSYEFIDKLELSTLKFNI
jgi:hypothetical protein